ncbi:MAG: hypothetical protein IH994_13160, partial [Proteobacteria bacterium]|nr:hypothetical protein [Pseudomonadota bacterium]
MVFTVGPHGVLKEIEGQKRCFIPSKGYMIITMGKRRRGQPGRGKGCYQHAFQANGDIVMKNVSTAAKFTFLIAGLGLLAACAGSGGTGSDPVQNHMTIAGEHQVLLRVTIAEMSRQATRQLGINGYLAGDNFQDVFVLNNIANINPANIGAVDGAPATGPIPFAVGGGGIAVSQATTLSLGFPRVQMQVFLQALRENGLSRTLAEPNLITLSGHEAEFLAGGRFPIPVPQGGAGGSTAITIQYEEFGARIRFLPVVLGGNRIRMTVSPEVSELDFTSAVNLSGFVVPGLTQRSATTTVELASGQTIVIAGLLRDEVRANSTKIPWLGDVPILGSLFRSVRYQRNQTELVVMVTPEIVAPLNPDQVPPVPGEDLVDPTDWELFGLALLQGGESPFSHGVFPPETPVPTGVDGSVLPGAVQGPFGPSSQIPRFPGGPGLATPPGPLFGPWGPASLANES